MVDSSYRDGKKTVFQALNPSFLAQIPYVKLQMLRRTCEHLFYLNNANTASVRITATRHVQQREDSFEDAPIALICIRLGCVIENLQYQGAVFVVMDVI